MHEGNKWWLSGDFVQIFSVLTWHFVAFDLSQLNNTFVISLRTFTCFAFRSPVCVRQTWITVIMHISSSKRDNRRFWDRVKAISTLWTRIKLFTLLRSYKTWSRFFFFILTTITLVPRLFCPLQHWIDQRSVCKYQSLWIYHNFFLKLFSFPYRETIRTFLRHFCP